MISLFQYLFRLDENWFTLLQASPENFPFRKISVLRTNPLKQARRIRYRHSLRLLSLAWARSISIHSLANSVCWTVTREGHAQNGDNHHRNDDDDGDVGHADGDTGVEFSE